MEDQRYVGSFLEALRGDNWKRAGAGERAFPAGNCKGKSVEGRKSLVVLGRARMLLGLEHGP